jgi:hypothetical protein
MQDDPQIHGEATGLRAASDRGESITPRPQYN